MSGLAGCQALLNDKDAETTRGATADFGAGFLPLILTPEQLSSLGVEGGTGVMVVKVERNSAADKAGLQEADMLLELDGSPAAEAIRARKPGDEITLTVLRRDLTRQWLVAKILSTEPPEVVVFRYLRELSYVNVDCWPVAEGDPFGSLSRQDLSGKDIDLLLNVTFEGGPWEIYVAETNPRRVAWLLNLAHGIRLVRGEVEDSKIGAPLLYKVGPLGGPLPLRPALLYYPQSADTSLALLPSTFSLIVCFLSFTVAAPSLIRERELHTLEILLGAPGIRGHTVLVGKTLLPVGVSLLASLVMLVVVQAVYGLYVKADVVLFLLFMVLPILSSTLLGLLVSALARSQVQTVMASAIYFFCLLLLSGFLYPTEAGTPAIQTVTRSLGLTYLLDPASAWFFGAEPFRNLSWLPLVIQCLVYAALAGLAWRKQLRRM
jgi:ABC-type multidrug transport system permease subunit